MTAFVRHDAVQTLAVRRCFQALAARHCAGNRSGSTADDLGLAPRCELVDQQPRPASRTQPLYTQAPPPWPIPVAGVPAAAAITPTVAFAPDRGKLLPAVEPTSAPILTFRTIDVRRDVRLAVANHVDACIASFGDDARFKGESSYVSWLRSRVEEFPDGHVLAYRGRDCVGQLELQVPYGLNVGYVNLFYVTDRFRGQGFGRLLHDYAEGYFRSWEASRIELHVSPTNEPAVGFYRKMGYRLARIEPRKSGMWLMVKTLACPVKEGSER